MSKWVEMETAMTCVVVVG